MRLRLCGLLLLQLLHLQVAVVVALAGVEVRAVAARREGRVVVELPLHAAHVVVLLLQAAARGVFPLLLLHEFFIERLRLRLRFERADVLRDGLHVVALQLPLAGEHGLVARDGLLQFFERSPALVVAEGRVVDALLEFFEAHALLHGRVRGTFLRLPEAVSRLPLPVDGLGRAVGRVLKERGGEEVGQERADGREQDRHEGRDAVALDGHGQGVRGGGGGRSPGRVGSVRGRADSLPRGEELVGVAERGECGDGRHDDRDVLLHEARHGHHGLAQHVRPLHGEQVVGVELLAEFRRQKVQLLLLLADTRLQRIVRLRELVRYARAFGECACGLLLRGAQGVDAVGECGERLRHAAAAHVHFGQLLCEGIEAALSVEGFDEGEHGLVRVRAEQVGKLLHVQSRHAREFGRLGVEQGEYVLHGRRALLHADHALVEHGGEAHDLRLREARLPAHACEAGGELHEVALGGGGALGEVVDDGAGGEHGLFESHAVRISEELRDFANVLHRAFAQVLTEGHVDLVGRFHEVEDLLPGRDAEPSRVGGERVEPLDAGGRVELAQFLVQGFHLVSGEPGVLLHAGHCRIHGGPRIDVLLHGPHQPLIGHRTRGEDSPQPAPLLAEGREPSPQASRLLCRLSQGAGRHAGLLAYLCQFALGAANGLCEHLPLVRVPLHLPAGEHLVQLLQRSLQLLHALPFEVIHDAGHGLRRVAELVELLLRLRYLALQCGGARCLFGRDGAGLLANGGEFFAHVRYLAVELVEFFVGLLSVDEEVDDVAIHILVECVGYIYI